MSNQELPALAKLSEKLASDNHRIRKFVDTLSDRVGSVVDAAKEDNWDEVDRLCNYITRTSSTYGFHGLAEKAQQVSDAIHTTDNKIEHKRRVLKLIGECGRTNKPSKEPTS